MIIIVYALTGAGKLLLRIDNENYFIFTDILLISVIVLKIFFIQDWGLETKRLP